MELNETMLKELYACADGLQWYRDCGSPTVEGTVEKLLAEKKYQWANWLMPRMLPKIDAVRYAVFAAEQAIDIFESKYPDNKRPRAAIDAAKAWIANPSAAAAMAAAKAADAAADADRAAAWAAARAADAAAAAAWAAAWAAYTAADADGMYIKIINYGLGLLPGCGVAVYQDKRDNNSPQESCQIN